MEFYICTIIIVDMDIQEELKMGLQDAKFMSVTMITILLVFGLFSILVPEADINIVSDGNQFKQWFSQQTGYFDVVDSTTNTIDGDGSISSSDNASAFSKITNTDMTTETEGRSDDFSFFSFGVVWDLFKALGNIANIPAEVVGDLINLEDSTSHLRWVIILVQVIWILMWTITLMQILTGR